MLGLESYVLCKTYFDPAISRQICEEIFEMFYKYSWKECWPGIQSLFNFIISYNLKDYILVNGHPGAISGYKSYVNKIVA